MTDIQREAIPHLLNGEDVLAKAKTGSGKTLAFLIPLVHGLLSNDLISEDGIRGLIITPTRELAVQIGEELEKLIKNTDLKYTLAIGGTSKAGEVNAIKKGVNIIVGCPGRVVDHLLSNTAFNLENLTFFIIDEADKVMDGHFRDQMHEIIQNLPKERQTALFSATLTPEVSYLQEITFYKKPVFIDVDKDEKTVDKLKQHYVLTRPEDKLLVLTTFLKRTKAKKVMVFFNTKSAVKFHQNFFEYLGIKVKSIHGDQPQTKRIEAFNKFRQEGGILLCTDVAARGLDIPQVEWIIQYDPPLSTTEYIHRVGRSARAGESGNALVILLESEKLFLDYLVEQKLFLKELPLKREKLLKIDKLKEAFLAKDPNMYKLAREAFKTFLLSYESHPLKEYFNIEKLDIKAFSKSFCFAEMPELDIRVITVDKSKSDASWINKEKAKKKGK